MLPSTEEAGLFEGLRRRDPHAMTRLYDSFGWLVYSLIYRIVQDAAVAEDLVQETFLRVWNQAHSIDPNRGSPAAWVLTVARNRAIDWRRSVAGKPDRTCGKTATPNGPAISSTWKRCSSIRTARGGSAQPWNASTRTSGR